MPAQPRPLSLDEILTKAVDLADLGGLDAVTLRKVASELDVRPMRMYTFIDRKDDLIELMVDRVIAEMLLDEVPADWRTALHAITRRALEVGYRHPWLMTAVTLAPAIGPNSVRQREQSLAAVAPLGLDRERTSALLVAVDAYTMGYGTFELAERAMRLRDGLGQTEWLASAGAYFSSLQGGEEAGRLGAPGLAGQRGGFQAGLDWLLDGFIRAV